jgi:hypothetical protein
MAKYFTGPTPCVLIADQEAMTVKRRSGVVYRQSSPALQGAAADRQLIEAPPPKTGAKKRVTVLPVNSTVDSLRMAPALTKVNRANTKHKYFVCHSDLFMVVGRRGYQL